LFPLCIFENGHTLILAWDREIIKQKKKLKLPIK
jgi:hypothetical protein